MEGRSSSEAARIPYSCANIKAVTNSDDLEPASAPTYLIIVSFPSKTRVRVSLHKNVEVGIENKDAATVQVSLTKWIYFLYTGLRCFCRR